MQGQAVGDGGHAVLAHPKAEVALLVLALLEVAIALHEGHVAGCQVGGATDEPCTELAISPSAPRSQGQGHVREQSSVCAA